MKPHLLLIWWLLFQNTAAAVATTIIYERSMGHLPVYWVLSQTSSSLILTLAS